MHKKRVKPFHSSEKITKICKETQAIQERNENKLSPEKD